MLKKKNEKIFCFLFDALIKKKCAYKYNINFSLGLNVRLPLYHKKLLEAFFIRK